MDYKFSKDSGDSQQQEAPNEKKRQSSLLILLLLLVSGFTYLYFFTGLIKPQETKEIPKTTVTAPQAVKIPLPPRNSRPAGPEGETPEKAEVVTAAPAVKPDAITTKPVPVATTKVHPAPSKLKEEPKINTALKETSKKIAVADKKNVPPENAEKRQVPSVQLKTVAIAKAKKTSTEPWSIVVGSYVLEEALSADMGRVRKAGFKPVIKPASRINTSMSRLFVSEFDDRAAAVSILEKLKRFTSDAFVIEQGGRFIVYAGSYLHSEAAVFEKERLKTAGFTVTIKQTDIAIPSQSLSVGPFKSKDEAAAALVKLKGIGLKATLLQR